MSHALVTGAGRGIGLELCRQLSARGDDVIATCRTSTPELDALGVRVLSGIEVTDPASIERLEKELAGQPIELLLNNAGVLTNESLDDLDTDRIRRQLEVNSIAPLVVTQTLLPNLRAAGRGAKVGILTSLMGSMADNGSGGRYGYRMSKAAVNAAGVSLARDLASEGILVVLLHPGMVATDMTGGRGIDVGESVTGLLRKLDALEASESGTFWHSDGRELPW